MPRKKATGRKPRPVEWRDVGPRNPWERQPNESKKAFSAFANYLRAGDNRSTRKTAEELDKHASQITRWAYSWTWRDRVQAFEVHQERRLQREHQKQIDKMHKRQARDAVKIQKAAMNSLGEFVPRKGVDAKKMGPGTAARVFDIGVKVERTSHGVPDTITENTTVVTTPDEAKKGLSTVRAAAIRAQVLGIKPKSEE